MSVMESPSSGTGGGGGGISYMKYLKFEMFILIEAASSEYSEEHAHSIIRALTSRKRKEWK